jgi:hypothetical protein
MGWQAIAGAIGSALGDAGGGLLGSVVQDKFNKRQLRRSHDLYQQRYQDTVKDMYLAGINPILAATGGFSVGSGPAMPSTPMSNTQMDIAGSYKDIQEGKKSEAETGKKIQEKYKVIEEIAKTRAEKGLITAQEKQALQSIERIKAEIAKIFTTREKERAQTELTNVEKDRAKKLIKVLEKNLAQLTKVANVYKGPAGQIITYLREVLKALPISGHGSMSTVRMIK